MTRESSIGVFDSGLGGLTVVSSIIEQLPKENIVYLGDNARVPYGTRSPQTVIRYAQGCARRLCEHDIKLLVVACNTVSAVALEILRAELEIPVLGVIEPGARAGVRASQSGRIGVIGTRATISSGAYFRAITNIDSRTEVFSHSTPLLVPLAEEGWTTGEIPHLVVRRYLETLVKTDLDTLLLGCTHYPLLHEVIQEEITRLLKRPIPVVDSAKATATELSILLAKNELLSKRDQKASLHLMVTDMPEKFSRVAARFLGQDLQGLAVQQIDL